MGARAGSAAPDAPPATAQPKSSSAAIRIPYRVTWPHWLAELAVPIPQELAVRIPRELAVRIPQELAVRFPGSPHRARSRTRWGQMRSAMAR